MDEWITGKAAEAQARNTAKVHVCLDAEGKVVAMFAFDIIILTPAEVSRNAAGGLSTVRTLLLARFARHIDIKGNDAGLKLMAEVMREAVVIADKVPLAVLALDAKNEKLAAWYATIDFVPTKTDPLRLYMPMAKVRASVEAADAALRGQGNAA
jgi:hypothetical protein